jgi:leader peptidase (prepilin peptidase)/N-methyltransferase
MGALMDADTARVLRGRWAAMAVVSGPVAWLLAWRVGAEPELAAYLVLGVATVVLSFLDVALMRLPDVIVLPATALLLGALTLTGEWDAIGRGLLAWGALALAHLAVAMVFPGGLGAGDVKASGLVGLALGFAGWGVLVAGLFYAYAGVGLAAAAVLALGRGRGRTHLPFGPFLLGGAVAALALNAA